MIKYSIQNLHVSCSAGWYMLSHWNNMGEHVSDRRADTWRYFWFISHGPEKLYQGKKDVYWWYIYIWARPARLAWRVLHFFQFQTCIWGNLGCLRLKIWLYCVQGVAMYTWLNFQSISSNSFKLRAQHSCATRVTKSWRDNLHDLIQLGTVAQGKVIRAHGLFYASTKFLAVKISKFYIY